MPKQKTPHYIGRRFARMDRADGGLPHAIGASNYQVSRANRSHPEYDDGHGFTYNHAPMLTYFRGYFYLQYLGNPVDEHRLGGASMIARSKDGVNWSPPVTSFPVIRAKAGVYPCIDGDTITIPEDTDAFMHQRVAFYHADGRLLTTGFYGHAPHASICPWVNYGMGRAVREVYPDGSMGPLYFLRILTDSGWTEDKLPFPFYKKSEDQGFVAACEKLLADRLYTQQWAEEHGDRDEYVYLKGGSASGKAENAPYEKRSSFCWYHIDDQNIVGLWKQGVVGRSEDGGDNWTIHKEYSFATSGAKSWGQRTDDGKFAIAYVSSIASDHRYPLCVVTSEDGAAFDDLLSVFGEVPPHRYKGLYKDFGPQYIRGILEGHEEYPKNAMFLCHSVNKEDIWVTRVPVPITGVPLSHACDRFEGESPYIEGWNIYSPLWAPVRKTVLPDGSYAMRLADKDPADYALAERAFPQSEKMRATVELMCAGGYEDDLYIELADENGLIACRVRLGGGRLAARFASEDWPLCEVEPDVKWHTVTIEADCETFHYEVFLNGKPVCKTPFIMMQKVLALSRLTLRTKPPRVSPTMEELPEKPDMTGVDDMTLERVYFARFVKTEPIDRLSTPAEG